MFELINVVVILSLLFGVMLAGVLFQLIWIKVLHRKSFIDYLVRGD
jgi:hypothetical protein